ncbi:MAG: hypothetical protein PIK35_12365 [Enterobacter roggenkampii]
MTIFAINSTNNPLELEKIITTQLPEQDRHKVDANFWFITPPNNLVTPKEVSDFLGVSNGEAGLVVIFLVSSYYGYHNRNVWAWLDAKRG